MAALQNIRNHATLLIGIVAVALAAFVVGDLLTSTSSIIGRERSIVGSVNGKEISIVDFNEKEKQFSEIIKQQYAGQQAPHEGDIRNFVWNKFINDALIESEMEEIGMAVTNEEVSELVSSANHPMLMSIPLFRDQSGRFNPSQVSAFLQYISMPEESLDENQKAQQQQLKAQWAYWEGQIKSQLANDKLANLVSSAVSYPTTIVNLMDSISANDKSAVVIKKSYSPASNDIEVSDTEKKNMYEKMKKQFFALNNGGYRAVDAIIFNVKPSQQDYEDAKAGMEEMKEQIKNADEADLKIIFSDPSSVFTYNNFFRSEKDIEAAFQAFAFNAKKDSVSDVIFEGGDFMVARKMDDVKMAPDSANISLIVLAAATKDEVKQKADSINKCLSNGEKFEDLAAKHSLDKNTADKGGEIGWVKEGFPLGTDDFDAKVFGGAKKGDIFTFDMPENQMTFIVKVNNLTTPVRKAKILVYGSKLEPSTDTYTDMYNAANKFIIDNNTKDKFIANADSQGLDITHLTPLGENDPYIQFLGQSNTRDIIKWAWSHEVGDVSGVFEVGDSYIVGTLVNAVDGEYAPLSEEYVSNQVLRRAKNEACAKKFTEELAKEDNFSNADTVNINFMRDGVPGIGREPKLVAAISALPVDAVSDAIVGEMGVYKVKVLNENPSNSKANIQMLNRDLKGMVANRMYESLRKDADVSDNRSNFY